jgi:hypothetical protein
MSSTRTAHHDPSPPRPSRRQVVWMFLRATASIIVLVTLYYLLPLDHSSQPFAITVLIVGLAAFVGLVAFQVGTIMRSPVPGLRALVALATSVPLFLLLFSATYVVMASLSRQNFGGPLTHTDGLYFSVTVFATVGFGDITAKSEAARLVVTVQMITDLIILSVGVRVIVGAVRRSQRHRAPQPAEHETEQEHDRDKGA